MDRLTRRSLPRVVVGVATVVLLVGAPGLDLICPPTPVYADPQPTPTVTVTATPTPNGLGGQGDPHDG